jgi:hypothetical protein
VDPHPVDADPDSTYRTDADWDSHFYLMRIRFFFHADADPDPIFRPDAYPDQYPNPSFQIKAQTQEKVLK